MAAGTTHILGSQDGKLTGAVSFGGAARVGSARVAAVYIKASILVSAGLGKLGESVARFIWFSFPASVVLLMSQANCRCNMLSCTLHGSKCTFSRVTSCDVVPKVQASASFVPFGSVDATKGHFVGVCCLVTQTAHVMKASDFLCYALQLHQMHGLWAMRCGLDGLICVQTFC